MGTAVRALTNPEALRHERRGVVQVAVAFNEARDFFGLAQVGGINSAHDFLGVVQLGAGAVDLGDLETSARIYSQARRPS